MPHIHHPDELKDLFKKARGTELMKLFKVQYSTAFQMMRVQANEVFKPSHFYSGDVEALARNIFEPRGWYVWPSTLCHTSQAALALNAMHYLTVYGGSWGDRPFTPNPAAPHHHTIHGRTFGRMEVLHALLSRGTSYCNAEALCLLGLYQGSLPFLPKEAWEYAKTELVKAANEREKAL